MQIKDPALKTFKTFITFKTGCPKTQFSKDFCQKEKDSEKVENSIWTISQAPNSEIYYKLPVNLTVNRKWTFPVPGVLKPSVMFWSFTWNFLDFANVDDNVANCGKDDCCGMLKEYFIK